MREVNPQGVQKRIQETKESKIYKTNTLENKIEPIQ